jgi:tetratricopeptide (TPR) repeat protein
MLAAAIGDYVMALFKQFATTLLFSGFLMQGAVFAAQPKGCLDLNPFRQISESYAACEAELQKAGADNAHSAKLHAQMGEVLYWSERFDLAINSFNKALALDSKLVETKIQRGWAFIRVNEYQRAFQDFSDALEEKPDSGRAMFAIGFMYDIAGDSERAFIAYKQAVELSPTYHLARSALANAYYTTRNEPDLGLAEYDRLISYGEAELNNVQFFDSLVEFQTGDFYATTLYNRASARYNVGQVKDALLDVDWLLNRYPDAFGPKELKSGFLSLENEFDAAVKLAAEASEICYKNPQYQPCEKSDATLVWSMLSLGKNKEAADIGRRLQATRRQGKFVEKALYFAGLAMKRSGAIEEARQYISAPVQTNSDYRALLITQLMQNGFYLGDIEDEMNDRILNGLEACLLDDDCLIDKS